MTDTPDMKLAREAAEAVWEELAISLTGRMQGARDRIAAIIHEKAVRPAYVEGFKEGALSIAKAIGSEFGSATEAK